MTSLNVARLLAVASISLIALPALAGHADDRPNSQNCQLPWPYSVNIVDAKGQCVGTIVGNDENDRSTVVARQIGDTLYGIQVTRAGIQKGLAEFYYATADCSGTAYMPNINTPLQPLFADLNGVLWTAGAPPPGGTIIAQCYRQAPAGAPNSFPSEFNPFAVGAAEAVDGSLVNSLTPPFTVARPGLNRGY